MGWKTISAICSLILIIPTVLFISDSSKIINPDGIEYVVIASHYLRGDFFAALNGVWSPMLSWVFIIPEALNIDPFLFFRFFTIIVAIGIIFAWNYLFYILAGNQKMYQYFRLFSSTFILLFCTYMVFFTPITPDMLSVLCALILIIILLKFNNDAKIKLPILSGVVIGLGLYAKMYFFYFGIAILILFYLVRLLQNRKDRKLVFRNILVSFGVIFILVSPWALAMKYKYDKLSLTPISGLALSRQGPQIQGPVLLTIGLIEPPYEKSITAREEQTKYPVPNWSPLNSKNDMAYYFKSVLPNNLNNAFKLMGPLAILTFLLLTLLLFKNRKPFCDLKKDLYNKNSLNAKGVILLSISASIYVSGYVLQHLDGGLRYIWPAYIFLIMSVFVMLCWYFSAKNRTRFRQIMQVFSILLVFIIFLIIPLKNTFIEYKGAVKSGKDFIKIAGSLKTLNIPTGSRIASNDPYAASYLCYYLELRCYGKPLNNKVEEQLRQYEIEYMFNFKSQTLVNINKIPDHTTDELQVFKLP